ncbi:MAG: Ig domain-containing protein [Clostridium sp.]|nr:Ig domain-containing protein [Clostridium sp.]
MNKKKRVLILQFVMMYLMVALNLVPLQVKAQEQYVSSQVNQVITLGETVSSSVAAKENNLYLLKPSSDKKVKFNLHTYEIVENEDVSDAVEEGENQTGEFTWKIIKVDRQSSGNGITYKPTQVVLDQTIELNESKNYVISKTFQLEKAYYLISLENTKQGSSFDYKLSTEEIITYATSLQIPKSVILKKGEKKKLSVTTVKPQNAVKAITWSSSNANVAKVNKTTGEITAVKYGQANIKATLKNGSSYTCKVSVEQPKLNRTSLTLLKGYKGKLQVTKSYSKVTYSSSSQNVASVDSKGNVTAKNQGTATITAKVGSTKLICKVKVEVPKISVTKVSLNAGKTKQLKVTGTTQKVTWKSSNRSVATVTSNGKVTAKKGGNATITAIVAGKKVLTCTITIKVKVNKPSNQVGGGTVYITDTGSKYHSAGCRYLWNSSHPISRGDARSAGYEPCSRCQ